jgi:hypothetical protein
VQLITITIEIKSNGDSSEEKVEVKDDMQKEIVGGIFMEVDEKKKLCLSAMYIDFSKSLSRKEPHVRYRKENLRTSFLQVGVSHIGCNLSIFSVKMKNRKIFKNKWEQGHMIRILSVLRQWKYKKKDLIVKLGFYFILFSYLQLIPYFLSLLGLDLLNLFSFLTRIRFTFTTTNKFTFCTCISFPSFD